MKISLLNVLVAGILLLAPGASFAQTPSLGTAANFVLFTTAGAVTNTGTAYLTHLTGNVGSNSGSSTGFGNVDGVMHDGDLASGAAAADLNTAYNQLNTAIPTFFPAPLLGNGDTLLPGVYHIPSAATLNLNLVLNALGNPNAVFIFQIQGSFSTNALSKVIMINGQQAANVFWKVEGLVSMATGTTMRGTIVAHNAAINMSPLDTLEGRALSIAGSVTTNTILAYIPVNTDSPLLSGPTAPALASTAAYGLFTSIGPMTNTGISYVFGDVGTNSGLTSGFDPLLVSGMIHPIPDASTAAAAADLINVYNYLNALPIDIELLYPAEFGNDLVLTPHTYLLNAATMLTNRVFLNAEGNPAAVFVMHINGAFNTSTLSRIVLTNGAQAKNIYWLVNGAVNVFDNSLFNGNIIGAGAINFSPGDTLNGRALTKNGAVNTAGSYFNSVPAVTCIAPAIGGTKSVCPGDTTALNDSTTGGIWTSSNPLIAMIGSSSGIVTGILPGNTIITYTTPAACVSTATVTVNTIAAPITGLSNVCVGDSITLLDVTPGGGWISSNTSLATVGTGSGIVTGIADGRPTISYTVPGSCPATKTIIVGANAGVITGPSRVCIASTILLTDTTLGGIWSSSNAKATVVAGLVTGFRSGLDTIMYTVTNICGTAVATKAITIDSITNAGAITGDSVVCVGSSITLTDTTTGGIWSSNNNAIATVFNGVVTGHSAGIDTINYTVINGCGIKSTAKTVTVNPLPDEGAITGPSAVCVGSSIVLTDAAPGGTWSLSNTNATLSGVTVTGVSAGMDTVSYTVTNGCGTASALDYIMINPLPQAGTITGPSSVCVASSITLTDTTPGGIWSSDNTNATVVGGIVTGASAGTVMISYSVTNICNTASATKSVTVNPLPDAGTITGPSAVCIGSSITLADIITGGTWSSSNANATATGDVITGVAAGTALITYTFINECGTDRATKALTINAAPAIPVIATQSPATVCTGTMYQNFGAATLPAANTSYAWSASNAVVWAQGTAHQYALVNLDASGTATVTLTATTLTTGCTNSDIVTVTVGTAVAQTPEVLYFNGHFVCIPSNEDSYQWGYDDLHTLDSTILGGEINQDYLNVSPNPENAYWVMTTSGGCLQKTYLTIPASAVQNVNENVQVLSLYPNPASNIINVDINTTINGSIEVIVLNAMGQKINTIQTLNNKATIDVAALPGGYYMIACYNNGVKIATARFIKN